MNAADPKAVKPMTRGLPVRRTGRAPATTPATAPLNQSFFFRRTTIEHISRQERVGDETQRGGGEVGFGGVSSAWRGDAACAGSKGEVRLMVRSWEGGSSREV